MLIAPALASFLFKKGGRSWQNPVMVYLASRYREGVTWAVRHRMPVFAAALAIFAFSLFLSFSGVIGSEFLPHLDEGAIWFAAHWLPVPGQPRVAGVAERGP